MPDEFGPQVEADAYRVYLYMSAFPDHGVVRTTLQVGDDASVSFALWWLHECQPKPLIGGELFDAWRVERFTERHTYVLVTEGLAERQCHVKSSSSRTFREWKEELSGASDLRNGLRSLYPEVASSNQKRGRLMARPSPKRRRKPRVALTPFQQKMQALKEEARKNVAERQHDRQSPAKEQWQRLIANARSGAVDVRRS